MVEKAKVKLREFLDSSVKTLDSKVDLLLAKLIDKIKIEMAADPYAVVWTAKVECVDLLAEKQNGHYPKLSLEIVRDVLVSRGYRAEIVN